MLTLKQWCLSTAKWYRAGLQEFLCIAARDSHQLSSVDLTRILDEIEKVPPLMEHGTSRWYFDDSIARAEFLESFAATLDGEASC